MSAFKLADSRKDQLFRAWIEYLTQIHSQFEGIQFDDGYEGLAEVTEISENFINLKLDNKKKIKGLRITSEIKKHLTPEDTLYIVLGRLNGTWWPIHLVSVGTILGEVNGQSQFHMTINPLLTGHI